MASLLHEILEQVKEENLTLTQCESMRDQLVHIYTTVLLERATLRKKEALFFMQKMAGEEKMSDVAIKRKWRMTPEGQRLIDLEAYKMALPKEISSLQSRIFGLIR